MTALLFMVGFAVFVSMGVYLGLFIANKTGTPTPTGPALKRLSRLLVVVLLAALGGASVGSGHPAVGIALLVVVAAYPALAMAATRFRRP